MHSMTIVIGIYHPGGRTSQGVAQKKVGKVSYFFDYTFCAEHGKIQQVEHLSPRFELPVTINGVACLDLELTWEYCP